jgi:hypothetical protein
LHGFNLSLAIAKTAWQIGDARQKTAAILF